MAQRRAITVNEREWEDVWKNYLANGEKNRKQIDFMLFSYPKMNLREIAATVGCSHQTVSKHKRRILSFIGRAGGQQ